MQFCNLLLYSARLIFSENGDVMISVTKHGECSRFLPPFMATIFRGNSDEFGAAAEALVDARRTTTTSSRFLSVFLLLQL